MVWQILEISMAYPVIQDIFPENWTRHEARVQTMVPAGIRKNRRRS
jgi:hypothetical protein